LPFNRCSFGNAAWQSGLAHKTPFATGLAVTNGANGRKALSRGRTFAGNRASAFLTAKRG
jgi:hypothetical protein